jgi:hypothetical protein
MHDARSARFSFLTTKCPPTKAFGQLSKLLSLSCLLGLGETSTAAPMTLVEYSSANLEPYRAAARWTPAIAQQSFFEPASLGSLALQDLRWLNRPPPPHSASESSQRSWGKASFQRLYDTNPLKALFEPLEPVDRFGFQAPSCFANLDLSKDSTPLLREPPRSFEYRLQREPVLYELQPTSLIEASSDDTEISGDDKATQRTASSTEILILRYLVLFGLLIVLSPWPHGLLLIREIMSRRNQNVRS